MENTNDKIQNLREGRVATMTTDTDTSFSVAKNETKAQTKPNENLLRRIDELTRERVDAFESRQRMLDEQYKKQQVEAQVASKQDNQQAQSVEDKQEVEQNISDIAMPQYAGETKTQTQIQNAQEEDLEEQAKAEKKQRAKKVKFRIKFISIAVCIAIALFSGLAIHNAVKITKLSSEISTSQTQVEVNTAKYIYKISKLDDLIEDGKKAPVDSFQIGADRYLESFPEEIQDVTEIAESSNWFDRFVNKIRKFFGRA